MSEEYLVIASKEELREIFHQEGSVSDAGIYDLDLSDEKYFAQNFTNIDFASVCLHRTSLKDSLLNDCTFSQVDFSHANLEKVRFQDCVLEDCIFTETQLKEAVFFDCVLINPKGAHNFSHVTFDHCQLNHVCFHNPELFSLFLLSCTFHKVRFDNQLCKTINIHEPQQLNEVEFCTKHWLRSIFIRVDMTRFHFSQHKFVECQFVQSNLKETNFSRCYFKTSGFIKCFMDQALFIEARGSGLSFYQTSLHKASFSMAELPMTTLQEASLSGVDFSGANISLSNFIQAQCDHVNFHRANVTQSNFSYAQLDYSTFLDADVTLADLHGISQHETDWTGSNKILALKPDTKREKADQFNPYAG